MNHYFIGDNMKKIVIILTILMIPFIIKKNQEKEIIQIPNESIRIRIIANSNSLKDQFEKLKVTHNVTSYIQNLLKESTTKEESEQIIINNLSNIKNEVKNTLNQINSISQIKVNYGNNYFPTKTYKGIKYESGYYESLVITLGKGEGNNWWCVLFPPLCLMETDENNMEEMEYKLYITEILSKYN